MSSIEMLAMLIIGGAGYPLGALFGVTFIRVLQEAAIPSLRPWLMEILPDLFPFIEVVNITSAINPVLFGGAFESYSLCWNRAASLTAGRC